MGQCVIESYKKVIKQPKFLPFYVTITLLECIPTILQRKKMKHIIFIYEVKSHWDKTDSIHSLKITYIASEN